MLACTCACLHGLCLRNNNQVLLSRLAVPWFKLAVFEVQTVMKHAVEHYFGGGSELLNMHERLADLLLIALSASFEDGGDLCCSHSSAAAFTPTVFSTSAIML